MKTGLRSIIVVAGSVLALTALGQNGANQSTPQTQPQNPGQTQPSQVISSGRAVTNAATQGIPSSANTNAALESLVGNLQSLRSIVDQTLPGLSALNQQFGQQSQGLAGALENVFSRNKTNPNSSTGQQITNVLSALGSLVNRNGQQTPTLDQETLRNLATLEKDLQPVQQVLQTLNINSANQTNNTQVPTPTGR